MKNILFQTNKGLTLIEIMLSLAIMGIIALFSVPVYQSFMVRNDLDIATGTVAQVFRYAQTQSQAMHGDSSWGVYVGSGAITLFKGTSYASRDVDYDEETSFPSTISVSGLTEVVFDLLTGEPQTIGKLVISSVNGDLRTISINKKGIIFPNTSLSFGDWSILNEVATVPSVDTENGEKIQVVGRYAYIVRSGINPDFQVYDISNPESPILVGDLSLNANPVNLFVSGGYAYIASEDNNAELQVVSVLNSSNPQLVGLYDAPGNEDGLGVYVVGTHTYLVRGYSVVNNNFFSIDVTNPNSPTLLGSTSVEGNLFELVVSGSYAYIASSDNNEELKIIDISDPTDTGLDRVAGLDFPGNSDAWSIAISGSKLIMDNGGWFIVLSISNPTNPSVFATHQIPGTWWIYDISLSTANTSNGHLYAFVALYSPSFDFLVIDITDPVHPLNVVSHDTIGIGTLRGVAYSPLLDRVFVSARDDKELIVFAPN